MFVLDMGDHGAVAPGKLREWRAAKQILSERWMFWGFENFL